MSKSRFFHITARHANQRAREHDVDSEEIDLDHPFQTRNLPESPRLVILLAQFVHLNENIGGKLI